MSHFKIWKRLEKFDFYNLLHLIVQNLSSVFKIFGFSWKYRLTNQNFGSWVKIAILGSYFDFRLKFWFSWQNLDFLVKISIFESEFRFLSQIAIFDIRLNFRFLCEISIYMWKFRICFIFRFFRTKKLFRAGFYRILKFSVY